MIPKPLSPICKDCILLFDTNYDVSDQEGKEEQEGYKEEEGKEEEEVEERGLKEMGTS